MIIDLKIFIKVKKFFLTQNISYVYHTKNGGVFTRSKAFIIYLLLISFELYLLMFSVYDYDNNITKYLFLTLISFILILQPLFRYDGLLVDTDYIDFLLMDFSGLFVEISEHGIYRSLSITYLFILSELFNLIPFHSYIICASFYLTYFLLCEKILKLLG